MKVSLAINILKIFGLFIIYLAGSSVVFNEFQENSFLLLPLQGFSQLAFLFFPFLVLVKYEKIDFKKYIIGESKPRFSIYLYSILGWLGIFLMISSISGLLEYTIDKEILEWLKYLSEPYDDMISEMLGTGTPFWYSAFIIAIIPAIVEESIFRGYLQSSLNNLPKYLNYFIVAVLFSVLHFNPLSIIGLFIISIYLSELRSSTGSLLPSIAIHIINNSVMIMLYDYMMTSDIDINSTDEVSIGQILLTFGMGLFIAITNIIMIRKLSRES